MSSKATSTPRLTGLAREVLVTRPSPGLAETMSAVAARGWTPLPAPMLKIHAAGSALSPDAAGIRALVLTSAQAVSFLPKGFDRGVPVLCVGDATARRASLAGFVDVHSAGGDAQSLLALVWAQFSPAQAGFFLLACAQGQSRDLAMRLRQQGFRVRRRVVYEARAQRVLASDIIASLDAGRLAAILFFSRETAIAFMCAVPDRSKPALDQVRAIVISENAASALLPAQWKSIECAQHPDAASMIAALGPPMPS